MVLHIFIRVLDWILRHESLNSLGVIQSLIILVMAMIYLLLPAVCGCISWLIKILIVWIRTVLNIFFKLDLNQVKYALKCYIVWGQFLIVFVYFGGEPKVLLLQTEFAWCQTALITPYQHVLPFIQTGVLVTLVKVLKIFFAVLTFKIILVFRSNFWWIEDF